MAEKVLTIKGGRFLAIGNFAAHIIGAAMVDEVLKGANITSVPKYLQQVGRKAVGASIMFAANDKTVKYWNSDKYDIDISLDTIYAIIRKISRKKPKHTEKPKCTDCRNGSACPNNQDVDNDGDVKLLNHIKANIDAIIDRIINGNEDSASIRLMAEYVDLINDIYLNPTLLIKYQDRLVEYFRPLMELVTDSFELGIAWRLMLAQNSNPGPVAYMIMRREIEHSIELFSNTAIDLVGVMYILHAIRYVMMNNLAKDNEYTKQQIDWLKDKIVEVYLMLWNNFTIFITDTDGYNNAVKSLIKDLIGELTDDCVIVSLIISDIDQVIYPDGAPQPASDISVIYNRDSDEFDSDWIGRILFSIVDINDPFDNEQFDAAMEEYYPEPEE